MQKRWTLKQTPNQQTVQELAAGLGIDAVLSSLLLHRDIYTFDEARYFLLPLIEHLHDPLLMSVMEQAIVRIDESISYN